MYVFLFVILDDEYLRLPTCMSMTCSIKLCKRLPCCVNSLLSSSTPTAGAVTHGFVKFVYSIVLFVIL